MVRAAGLLTVHVVLVFLAASNFALLAWLWKSEPSWNFNFFSLSWSSGYGPPYVSDYSLWQVLTYVLAYAVGLAGYLNLKPYHQRLIVGAGMTLCLLGLGSFLFELSHWAVSHHNSLIANFPVAAIVVGLLGIVQLARGIFARLSLSPASAT